MLSEGELHVQAMRLVCEALSDREKTGLEVDWDVINQQLDHMDVIIYAEKEKRAAVEKDRDHWKTARQEAIEAGELMQAEIERLRKQLADPPWEASDEFVERQVLTAEQDQDAEIWKQRFDWAQNEVKYLRDRLDEERSVSAGLRQKLAELDAGTSEPEGQQ